MERFEHKEQRVTLLCLKDGRLADFPDDGFDRQRRPNQQRQQLLRQAAKVADDPRPGKSGKIPVWVQSPDYPVQPLRAGDDLPARFVRLSPDLEEAMAAFKDLRKAREAAAAAAMAHHRKQAQKDLHRDDIGALAEAIGKLANRDDDKPKPKRKRSAKNEQEAQGHDGPGAA